MTVLVKGKWKTIVRFDLKPMTLEELESQFAPDPEWFQKALQADELRKAENN